MPRHQAPPGVKHLIKHLCAKQVQVRQCLVYTAALLIGARRVRLVLTQNEVGQGKRFQVMSRDVVEVDFVPWM